GAARLAGKAEPCGVGGPDTFDPLRLDQACQPTVSRGARCFPKAHRLSHGQLAQMDEAAEQSQFFGEQGDGSIHSAPGRWRMARKSRCGICLLGLAPLLLQSESGRLAEQRTDAAKTFLPAQRLVFMG